MCVSVSAWVSVCLCNVLQYAMPSDRILTDDRYVRVCVCVRVYMCVLVCVNPMLIMGYNIQC